MTQRRSSDSDARTRTGDLIVSACVRHFESPCHRALQERIADAIEERIQLLNARERERLVLLITVHLARGDFMPEHLSHAPIHLRSECETLVGQLIVQAVDVDAQDLNTRYGRLSVALDKAARHRHQPATQCLTVSCGSARAPLEQVRQDGLMRHAGEAAVVLGADEWAWLFGREVAAQVESVTRCQPTATGRR